MSFDLGDYVDVAARLVEFREKHPDGSLQPADTTVPFQVVQIGGDTYVAVVAAAYRSPDDQRPGIGMAYEQYPGKTPYTRGSELQNAETSAWGRAIVAALAADTKKGIASADEVRNRQAERGPSEPTKDLIRQWVDGIYDAKDLDALRRVWTGIAGSGMQDTETVDHTGEPMTLGDLAMRRSEELKKEAEPDAGTAG